MIRCPDTGGSVFTGLVVAEGAQPDAVIPDRTAVGCPHCGDLHEWHAGDAWVEGAGETTPSLEQHLGRTRSARGAP